jgi:hypothetical protein
MKSYYYLLLLFVSFIILRCDNNTTLNPDNINKIKSRTSLPDCINGILTFESNHDYYLYYTYLDSIANNAEDSDSALAVIESGFAYNSYRAAFEVHELDSNELRNHYDFEYIPDIVLQSILNDRAEFAVADTFYVYLAKNRFYKIINNDVSTLVAFRSLTLGDDTPPLSLYNDNVSIVSGAGKDILIKREIFTPITPRGSNVSLSRHFDYSEDCIQDFGRRLNCALTINDGSNYIPLLGNWTITWGDGTADVINNATTINLIHEYGQFYQDITVEIFVNYNDPVTGAGNITSYLSHMNIHNGCRTVDYSEVPETPPTQGDWRMECKLWFNDNIFDNAIHAYTHSWHYNHQKNKWQKEKAEIDVWVDILWHHRGLGDVACGLNTNYEEDHEHDNNAKHRHVYKVDNSFGAWIPDNPHSAHRLRKSGGIDLNAELVLNPCD